MPKAKEIFLADYKAPVFLIDRVDLDFDIQKKETIVTAKMKIRRNPAAKGKKEPLFLDGENQRLISVKLDRQLLTPKDYKLTDEGLTILNAPDKGTLEITSANIPADNKALSGLYAAGPMLCTQCEAQGFRRITYYPDRPDVLSKFFVTIHADKKKFPVLLSNGNLTGKGHEADGRHFVSWEDPFKKPAYLFALVAGQLDKVTSSFKTMSGRKVLLEIYVEPGKKDETPIAMKALKAAMKWDEKTYGLEYDLDRFMIVAVSFFNMGAMENKGLNIFNDSCVLGRSDSATDSDIAFIERVVGHEYFHNYTGDRVTCRDWFQLSLKEGLTVFREQNFCGDMNTPDDERLENAWGLRAVQFSEDAGPMAHPIRPASYQAIDNFYTSTVYQKGAEVVRMIETMVGKEGFRKGLSLYLKKNDGTAATCEDFVGAMEKANKRDFKKFMLWYAQAGTPVLDVTSRYNAKTQEYKLTVKQSCPATPGQDKKKPMHMPLALGLLDSKGRDLIGTEIMELTKATESFIFKNIKEKPVPSLMRGFSAPVRLNYAYTEEELLFLMQHDTDVFSRFEASQKLYTKYILGDGDLPKAFIEALGSILKDKKLAPSIKSMMLAAPAESALGLALRADGGLIDPIDLYERRTKALKSFGTAYKQELLGLYQDLDDALSEEAIDGKARGVRSFKNVCLALLGKAAPKLAEPLAFKAAMRSQNMTDKVTGLGLLASKNSEASKKAFASFERKFGRQPNVMDNWLSLQSSARKKNVLASVKRLMKHKAFSIDNPNRVRSLFRGFLGNPFGFHAADGSGYKFMAEQISALDKINPMMAAGLAKAFLRWRDFTPKRQKMMLAAIKTLSKNKALSKNTAEVISKAIKG